MLIQLAQLSILLYFVLVLILGTPQVLLSVSKVIAFTNTLFDTVTTTRDLLSNTSSFLTRPFLFLCFVYQFCDLPGLSILDCTGQLFGLSEFSGMVTNKSIFSAILETGQALT